MFQKVFAIFCEIAKIFIMYRDRIERYTKNILHNKYGKEEKANVVINQREFDFYSRDSAPLSVVSGNAKPLDATV